MWFMYNTGVVLTDYYWYVIHVQYRCNVLTDCYWSWFMYNTGVVGMWFMYNTGVKVLQIVIGMYHVQYRCKGINRLLLVCDSCTIQV